MIREPMTRIRLLLLILLAGAVCLEGQQMLPVPAPGPGQPASVAQLISSARTELERGDLEAARSSLEHVLSQEETNKAVRLELTDVLRRMKRWRDAEEQARILMRQFPTDSEPLYLLALIAMQRGDPQTAVEFASRCLAQGAGRPEVYKVLAVSEYLLHDNDRFESVIRSVLDRNPRDAEAQYLLARYFFEVKRYGESLNSFQTLLALEPEHYKAHYYRGLVQLARGEVDLARKDFMASIEILERTHARYGWPFADLGRALSETGESGEALEWLARGIGNDPTCPKVYYEYARALLQTGPGEDVKNALLRAVSLDPGYTEAYYLLARYYKRSGDNQAAGEVLAKFRDLKDHPIPSPYGIPRQ